MDKSFKGGPLTNRISRVATTGSKPGTSWKPKILNKDKKSELCPYCQSNIEAGYAICPHCGRSLTPDKCSFCGAPKKINAKFCTRCGQPQEGIICPQCGTLNARNFCRKCNSPLTEMAQQTLNAAQNDPAFKRLQEKAAELSELHAQIEKLRNDATDQTPVELSQQDKALLDEYADILGMIGSQQPTISQVAPTPQIRKQYSFATTNIDDLLKAYKEKATEMNDALAALTPPPDYTPEQQRDYYAARKVATVVTETTCDMSDYKPTQWRCNFCSNLHDTPAECARPELGGVWEYMSVEEYISTHAKHVKTSLNID